MLFIFFRLVLRLMLGMIYMRYVEYIHNLILQVGLLKDKLVNEL